MTGRSSGDHKAGVYPVWMKAPLRLHDWNSPLVFTIYTRPAPRPYGYIQIGQNRIHLPERRDWILREASHGLLHLRLLGRNRTASKSGWDLCSRHSLGKGVLLCSEDSAVQSCLKFSLSGWTRQDRFQLEPSSPGGDHRRVQAPSLLRRRCSD